MALSQKDIAKSTNESSLVEMFYSMCDIGVDREPNKQEEKQFVELD